jgi:hypothetical protein
MRPVHIHVSYAVSIIVERKSAATYKISLHTQLHRLEKVSKLADISKE